MSDSNQSSSVKTSGSEQNSWVDLALSGHLPDQEPPTDNFPGATIPPTQALGNDPDQEVKNSPLHYLGSIFVLLLVYLTVQSFSFDYFHNKIGTFMQAVDRGRLITTRNVIVGAQITRREMADKIALTNPGVVSNWKNFINTQKQSLALLSGKIKTTANLAATDLSILKTETVDLIPVVAVLTKEKVEKLSGAALEKTRGLSSLVHVSNQTASLNQARPIFDGQKITTWVVAVGTSYHKAMGSLGSRAHNSVRLLISENYQSIIEANDELGLVTSRASQELITGTSQAISGLMRTRQLTKQKIADSARFLGGTIARATLMTSHLFIGTKDLAVGTYPNLVSFGKTANNFLNSSLKMPGRVVASGLDGTGKIIITASHSLGVPIHLAYTGLVNLGKVSTGAGKNLINTSHSLALRYGNFVGSITSRSSQQSASVSLSNQNLSPKESWSDYLTRKTDPLVIKVGLFERSVVATIGRGWKTVVSKISQPQNNSRLAVTKLSSSENIPLASSTNTKTEEDLSPIAASDKVRGNNLIPRSLSFGGNLTSLFIQPIRQFIQGAWSGQKLAVATIKDTVRGLTGRITGGVKNSIGQVVQTVASSNHRVVLAENNITDRFAVWKKQIASKPTARPKAIIEKLAEAGKRASSAALNLAEVNEPTIASSSGSAIAQISSTSPTALGLKNSFGLWFGLWFAPRSGFLTLNTYQEEILPIRRPISDTLMAISNTGTDLGRGIATAWGDFFGRFGSGGSKLSDAALREQLKQEIIKELSGETATIENGNLESTFAGTGIVVMKPTGSTTIDLRNVKNIQDSFSDRVIVNFDKDGQSGVIQPIFRDRLGDKYLFVATPLNKAAQ